jgi:hypothetical protein
LTDRSTECEAAFITSPPRAIALFPTTTTGAIRTAASGRSNVVCSKFEIAA